MTQERRYPSRRELAQRIGQASQWESRLLGAGYGCVPMTVAFTHGYSIADQEQGLSLSPSIEGVTQGAQFVAEKSDQVLTSQKVVTTNEAELQEHLSALLPNAECCWIAYFTSQEEKRLIGHMIGVIPTAPGEYSRWHSSGEAHIAKMDLETLAREITTDQHVKIPDVYIFAFTRK